jgi:thiol-disulfide isomerase/thioredoxin
MIMNHVTALVPFLSLAIACEQSAPPAPPAVPAAAKSPQQSSPPPAAKATGYAVVPPRLYPGAPVKFPPLRTFVQGTPVTAFEKGKTYAFHFFSTTCGHCAESAPTVAELARFYGQLGWQFISIGGDEEAALRAWLEKPEAKAHYLHTIVADPGKQATAALQYPTYRNSTPRIFLARDGVLLWAGHPDEATTVFEQIAKGTYDASAARADFILNAVLFKAKNDATAKVKECEKSGAWQPCLDYFDSIAAAMPAKASTFELQRFGVMIGAANLVSEGYAYGRALAQRHPEDIAVFRTLARTVLSTPAVRERDLDFAMEMAVRANEIGKNEDPRAADALALAWFSKGDREKAIEHQSRAIELQKDVKVRKTYEATLKKYQTQAPGPLPPGGAGPKRPAPVTEDESGHPTSESGAVPPGEH